MFEYNLLMDENARVSQIYFHELSKSNYPPKKVVLFRKLDLKPIIPIMTMEEHYEILNNILPEAHDSLLNLKDLDKINDENIISVTSKNINDNIVAEVIKETISGNTLIAATGIMKENILSLPKIDFLNVHSGYLPYSRGLDNFFYALIYNEVPGFSVHFVDRGVDTGDIIFRKKINIDLKNKGLENYDKKKVFITIKYFLVPYLKAQVFREFIECVNSKVLEITKIKQDIKKGRTFYKIHNSLKEIVMDKITM